MFWDSIPPDVPVSKYELGCHMSRSLRESGRDGEGGRRVRGKDGEGETEERMER